MEKFNLEKYLANPSRKLVTRDGRNARIVSTDRRYENYPIVALVQICDNYLIEEVYTYTENGEFEAEKSSKWDLFFAPEKHEGYVSIYRRVINDGYFTDGIFDSEGKARERGGAIATVKVEWEE